MQLHGVIKGYPD